LVVEVDAAAFDELLGLAGGGAKPTSLMRVRMPILPSWRRERGWL